MAKKKLNVFQDTPETFVDRPYETEAEQPVIEINKSQSEVQSMDEESSPEELIETMEEEEEDDFSEVLSDASLRLEQGSLYKMIMNHNLFDGLDSDPRAVKNVQREIRKFAKEQMEVMLGMRQPAPATTESQVFNELEVEILKKLAYKASLGATETANTPKLPKTVKQTGLNPIKAPAKPITKSKPSVSVPAQKSKPLPAKPETPVKRSVPDRLNSTIEQVAKATGVPKEILEQEVNYKPPSTQAEVVERNRVISEKMRTAKSVEALPMPNETHMAAIAAEQSDFMMKNPIVRKLD